MELIDLFTFSTVARTGGITRAAEELNTVQSNVTQRIKALEASLARSGAGAYPAPGADRLTTVKVPAQFEVPFLRAQEYVARYFAASELDRAELILEGIEAEMRVLITDGMLHLRNQA